jgi:membrane protein YqaA with SNARE-associated domain
MNVPAPAEATRPTVLRVTLGLLGLVVAVAILGKLLHDPVADFSTALVSRLGYGGVFGAVLLMDAVPGIGFQPGLFFGYTGGLGAVPLFVVTFAASFVASLTTFGCGRLLEGQPWLLTRLDRLGLAPWIRRQGTRALALAAVAPFPWPLAALGAGVLGLPIRQVLTAATARGLKIVFTLAAIQLGWGA